MSDPTVPSARGDGPATGPPAGEVLFVLVEALTELPSLRDESGRSTLIRLLRPAISAGVHHDSRARIFLFNLVVTCLEHQDGLSEMLAAVHFIEGSSRPMQRVLRTAAALPDGRARIGEDNGG